MLIKGNLLQKHQCCSGSVQLCISSLLNRSTSTSVGNNCLVGKDGKEELKLKREEKEQKRNDFATSEMEPVSEMFLETGRNSGCGETWGAILTRKMLWSIPTKIPISSYLRVN